MANNEVPVNNQDSTEIHLLPEMTTLSQGMMVAVDSEPTGTKSFNLSSALDSKASASDMTDLATVVSGKADASDVTALESAMEGKADASTTYTKTEVDQSIASIREVPAATAADAGKVLSVMPDGTVNWKSGGNGVVLVTGDTDTEKATNCQAIIDAGGLPILNVQLANAGHYYNKIYVYQYSDDEYFYFLGIYPQYYMDGSLYFNSQQNDIAFDFIRRNKTTFSGGGNDRGIDDLITNDVVTTSNDTVTIRNNRYTVIPTSITNGKSHLTVNIKNYGGRDPTANVAFELTPNVNMTLNVTRNGGTLKHSVNAGNTLTAGKLYQVTAVGNCWTMAEFEA